MANEQPTPDFVPLRKRQVDSAATAKGSAADDIGGSGPIDVPRVARVAYSSEAPDHPIEHLFDTSTGPTGTRWEAARPDEPQRIELEFDVPQDISRIRLEAAEAATERTQGVRLAASTDGGQSFAELRSQEYNFSPEGATFQREDWTVNLRGVTHLRIDVVPDQRGHGRASLTSLQLYR
jgi:hypothetical protein